jgi:protoporphyrinogen/coproporphyrinogen III oxidase
VKLSWKLKCIGRSEKEGYVLLYETPDGPMSVWARTVVLTVPSYVASNILRPLSVSKFPLPPLLNFRNKTGTKIALTVCLV